MANISTICITGFPLEAHPRELKNLCRFMQGFEGAHVAFARDHISTLFVKFKSPDYAKETIQVVNGIHFDVDAPSAMLKAEMARREMEVRSNPLPAPLVTQSSRPYEAYRAVARPAVPMSSPPVIPGAPALAGGHSGYVQAVAVPRHGNTGGELVTITILGIAEKGLVLEDLLNWFQDRTGFIALQVNERIDGIFAKFHSQVYAEQAIHDANALNFGAEWARRNLDDDIGTKTIPSTPYTGPPVAPHHASYSGCGANGGYGPNGGYSAKGSSPSAPSYSGDPIVTITVLGMREKGLSLEELQEWFTNRSGFVAMQINERIDGIFIKFSTVQEAQQAMQDGNDRFSFSAEWARRNLDDEKASFVATAPSYYGHYGGPSLAPPPSYGSYGSSKRQKSMQSEGRNEAQKNTVCILSMKEKGLASEEVQQWFRESPGFVALQVNDRLDGIFVKFSSNYNAELAIAAAKDRSYGVEWARRNLD